jgi:hypothetical protein
VDQDRFYLLQDMIMTSAVSRFGFVGAWARRQCPIRTGDPYVTDGLRLVLFFTAPSQVFDHIEFLDWERPTEWSEKTPSDDRSRARFSDAWCYP